MNPAKVGACWQPFCAPACQVPGWCERPRLPADTCAGRPQLSENRIWQHAKSV